MMTPEDMHEGQLQDFISENWRAGFELEVVFGSLDQHRFEEYERDPMDIASPAYCRAVAIALSEVTGQRWSAPRNHPKRPGYYVVPEYDLDPIDFPEGIVAGVELITPPVPLNEAEDLRFKIAEAIEELEGWFNFERNEHTVNFGWHINIDAGKDRRLEIARYAAAVDELAMLRTSGRILGKYTSPQRHAFGVPLLRELHAIDGADRISRNFENFIIQNAGLGKTYAANFERGHYIELRHFSVLDFLGDVPLIELIRPVLAALQMDHKSLNVTAARLLNKFQLLNGWLSEVRPLLACKLTPRHSMSVGRTGKIIFEENPAGNILWNGRANLDLNADGNYALASAIHHQLLADLPEAVALMALDVAETRLAGISQKITHPTMSVKIDELADSLKTNQLIKPVELASGSWWTKQ